MGHAIIILERISRISRTSLEADVKCDKEEEVWTMDIRPPKATGYGTVGHSRILASIILE